MSQYGFYKGQWRNDTKHGLGEEKSLVGTTFEGTWERNRKHGRGIRKMVFGTVEEQVGTNWVGGRSNVWLAVEGVTGGWVGSNVHMWVGGAMGGWCMETRREI